jgi:glutathione S-transferase
MIVVHGFGPYFGMPDGGPFVMKTMIQLKIAGLAFEHRATGVADAPKGKVPYIEDDGITIADSTLIRNHIEAKYGGDLDASLTANQRALAWALRAGSKYRFASTTGLFRNLPPPDTFLRQA